MIHNLYLILVVAARSAGVLLILQGLLAWATRLAFAGGVALGLPNWLMLLPSILSGILLWFLAKPCAALITRDLE